MNNHYMKNYFFKSILSALFLFSLNVTAEEVETKILDHFVVADVAAFAEAQSYDDPNYFVAKSDDIYFDPKLNKVWMVINYTGELLDANSKGETKLDAKPNGLPVSFGDGYLLFDSTKMTPYKVNRDSLTTMSKHVRLLTPEPGVGGQHEDKSRVMDSDDINSYQESLNLHSNLLQKIEVISFDTSSKEWRKRQIAQFILRPDGLINMKPVSIEVIIGEGDLPPEIKFYIKQQDDSWFQQYKWMVIIAGLLLSFFVLRRLM